VTLPLTRLAVAVAGFALSSTAGAGIAFANPDLSPVINTTCSYSQIVSALNAQDPGVAAQLNDSPVAQSYLRSFLASGPDQRLEMVQQLQGISQAQQYFGLVMQVANTCSQY
jgi:hemophore-related protein